MDTTLPIYESDEAIDDIIKSKNMSEVRGHLINYALNVFATDGFEFSWVQWGARVVAEDVFHWNYHYCIQVFVPQLENVCSKIDIQLAFCEYFFFISSSQIIQEKNGLVNTTHAKC